MLRRPSPLGHYIWWCGQRTGLPSEVRWIVPGDGSWTMLLHCPPSDHGGRHPALSVWVLPPLILLSTPRSGRPKGVGMRPTTRTPDANPSDVHWRRPYRRTTTAPSASRAVARISQAGASVGQWPWSTHGSEPAGHLPDNATPTRQMTGLQAASVVKASQGRHLAGALGRYHGRMGRPAGPRLSYPLDLAVASRNRVAP